MEFVGKFVNVCGDGVKFFAKLGKDIRMGIGRNGGGAPTAFQIEFASQEGQALADVVM